MILSVLMGTSKWAFLGMHAAQTCSWLYIGLWWRQLWAVPGLCSGLRSAQNNKVLEMCIGLWGPEVVASQERCWGAVSDREQTACWGAEGGNGASATKSNKVVLEGCGKAPMKCRHRHSNEKITSEREVEWVTENISMWKRKMEKWKRLEES